MEVLHVLFKNLFLNDTVSSSVAQVFMLTEAERLLSEVFSCVIAAYLKLSTSMSSSLLNWLFL